MLAPNCSTHNKVYSSQKCSTSTGSDSSQIMGNPSRAFRRLCTTNRWNTVQSTGSQWITHSPTDSSRPLPSAKWSIPGLGQNQCLVTSSLLPWWQNPDRRRSRFHIPILVGAPLISIQTRSSAHPLTMKIERCFLVRWGLSLRSILSGSPMGLPFTKGYSKRHCQIYIVFGFPL